MNILFLQSGHYAEAYLRFQDGGAETYRDQRASVEFVADLSKVHNVTIIAACGEPHDTQLTPSLRSVGIHYSDITKDWAARVFDSFGADTLIARMPHHLVLAEARRQGIPTLPYFADTFRNDGPRAIFRNLRLRRTLTGPNVPCVANHSLNASRSVVSALGLPARRVVPWDRTPVPLAGGEAKRQIENPMAPRAFFAGALNEAKGVGDILRAVKHVRDAGLAMTMTFAGGEEIDPWRTEAHSLGLGEAVTFLGRVGNDEVVPLMAEHDMVLVPTRHAYPEGLPNTIREGLASRSALIISDHPSFAGRLKPDQDCLITPEAQPKALAEAITRLCDDPALYKRLSENGATARLSLQFGMPWTELMATFLDDPKDVTGWVKKASLERLLNK